MKYYVIKSGSIRNGRFTGTGSLLIEQWSPTISSIDSYVGTFVADKLIDGTHTRGTNTSLVAAMVVAGETQPPFYDFAQDVARSTILEQYAAVAETDRVYNGPPGANAFGLWNFISSRGLDLQNPDAAAKKLLLARLSIRQGLFFSKFIIDSVDAAAPAAPTAPPAPSSDTKSESDQLDPSDADRSKSSSPEKDNKNADADRSKSSSADKDNGDADRSKSSSSSTDKDNKNADADRSKSSSPEKDNGDADRSKSSSTDKDLSR